MTAAPVLGWIGTGKMGTALASRLLAAGHQLAVWNRTAAKTEPLRSQGARVVDRAEDLGNCDVVFITIGGDKDLHDVVCGEHGLLAGTRRPTVIVDCSTISPQASASVRATAEAAGVALIAAPVSGNPNVVAVGKASIIASGPAWALAEVEPLLSVMAHSVVTAGSADESRLVKLCHNLYLGIMAQGMIEVTGLAEKGGVDRKAFLDFLGSTVLGSDWMRGRSSALAGRNWEPTFTVDLMQKDLNLGLASATALNAAMPLSTMVEQLATTAVARGLGPLDMLALDALNAQEPERSLVP